MVTEREKDLLAELLGVAAPWCVAEVLVSRTGQTVTVRIESAAPRTGLFGRRHSAPPKRQLRWEHVPLAGLRCKVMLSLRAHELTPQAPWTGAEPDGYTQGLQRMIMDLLLAGATLEQLTVLLRLPLSDLWRFKFKLDRGATAAPRGTAATPAGSPPPLAGVSAVPDADHPVWPALLLGRVTLDVRLLGLRLLLAKLQRDASLHRDPDLHRQAAHELYRYFARSAAVLQHELGQLRLIAAQGTHAPAQARPQAGPGSGAGDAPDELPDPSDPLWMALLQGERQLDIRALGLRLLLTQLRQQMLAIQDDEVRMVKMVELHRYFARHRAALGHEIGQLSDGRH